MKLGELIAAGDRVEWIDNKGKPQSQVVIRSVRIKKCETVIHCEYASTPAYNIVRHARHNTRMVSGGLPSLGRR